MILDDGICSVYSVSNSSALGNLPVKALSLKYQSWYKRLNFETSPVRTEGQEAISVSLRIRIMQNETIQNHDVATVDGVQHDISRAYHGVDEESGQKITDLTLEKLVKTYDIT